MVPQTHGAIEEGMQVSNPDIRLDVIVDREKERLGSVKGLPLHLTIGDPRDGFVQRVGVLIELRKGKAHHLGNV